MINSGHMYRYISDHTLTPLRKHSIAVNPKAISRVFLPKKSVYTIKRNVTTSTFGRKSRASFEVSSIARVKSPYMLHLLLIIRFYA